MNAKFIAPTTNREMLKSLIYHLERRFMGVKFHLLPDTLEIEVSGPGSDFAEIEAAALEFASNTKRLSDRIKPEVVFIHDVKFDDSDIPISGIMHSDIDGVCGLDHDLHETMRLLDIHFLRLAMQLGCNQLQVPILISKSDLVRSGYLSRDTHQVGFVSGPLKTGGAGEICCLLPAACLTTYPMIATKMPPSRRITALTPVFRMEGGRFPTDRPLERLREYHVRELVFFGNEDELASVQTSYFEFMKNLANAWSLPLEIATATDLFFHAEHSAQALHQLMHKTKYEVNFFRGGDRLALSSLNFHGNHFVKAFAIPEVGSACIGFGLERWLRALLLRYGVVQKVNEVLGDGL